VEEVARMLMYQGVAVIILLHVLMLVALTAYKFPHHPVDRAPGPLAATVALPLPLMSWAFCLMVFVDAVTDSPQDCGVDACGMAAMAAAILAVVTLLAYILGVSTSLITSSIMRRSRR
jgi:hypothetical protein